MTIGDGIAVAGCAWSAAYVTRWFMHMYLANMRGKQIGEAVGSLVKVAAERL